MSKEQVAITARSSRTPLTQAQIIELERRTDLGCQVLWQMPTEDLHEALEDLVAELDAFVDECLGDHR